MKSVNTKGISLIRDLLIRHFNVYAKLYGPYLQLNENYATYYQIEIIRKYMNEIDFYSREKQLKAGELPGWRS